jgi:hypothetical protein
MASQEMQRAIAAACFGPEIDAKGDGWKKHLRAHGVAEEDIAQVHKPRFWLYRKLIRANVTSLAESLLPRSRARINAAREGEFDAAFAAFLHAQGPRTHHLRDVIGEFVEWVLPRWQNGARAGVPLYMVDLLRYEALQFIVGTKKGGGVPASLTEVAVDRKLAWNEATTILSCSHAVHLLPMAEEDRSEPSAVETHLVFYRDAETDVRTLEVTPYVAKFLERSLGGASLGEAVMGAATACNLAPGEVLGGLTRLLGDWAERGLLLGAYA